MTQDMIYVGKCFMRTLKPLHHAAGCGVFYTYISQNLLVDCIVWVFSIFADSVQ